MSKADSKRPSPATVRQTLIRFMFGSAVVLIVVTALYFWTRNASLGALLVLFSAGGVGAVLGFLFGIPRVLTTDVAPASDASNPDRTRFTQNSNLEQISDWLTKIVVGVSLVEFKSLAQALRRLSDDVVSSLGLSTSFWPMASAILVCGGIFGFVTFYIWTRTQFLLLLQDTQDAADVQQTEVNRQIARRDAFAGDDSDLPLLQSTSALEQLWDSDPLKNQFGGKAESGEYKLEASLSPIASDGSVCGVELKVTRKSATTTLQHVEFHLHPTFTQQIITADFKDLTATAKIISQGAFVVGALVKGKDSEPDTRLELDLASLPGAPQKFRNG